MGRECDRAFVDDTERLGSDAAVENLHPSELDVCSIRMTLLSFPVNRLRSGTLGAPSLSSSKSERKRWEPSVSWPNMEESMEKRVGPNDKKLVLESECFGKDAIEWPIERMLDRGALVRVTAWVSPEMELGPSGVRVHAVITARLWRTVVSIPAFCKSWQSVRGRGNDILWIAAWALRRARERGSDFARFCVFLPIADDDDAPGKPLRIEAVKRKDRHWIVISLCEEFSLSGV